ncbi:hypothetical protein [Deinococcus enclensis]|uniref:Uncharacterized protein n=1 Tax=Deinococcus enclensis TaxID=1049582 RepID=A0ABT9MHS0_9DEIO|nr:hypothetical protein [Deinococcus enclensis]MDP9766140.1 hypothetical protein [Deinococcus enclensis]
MNRYRVRVTITQANGHVIASSVHGDLKVRQDSSGFYWDAELHIPVLQDAQAIRRSIESLTPLQVLLERPGGERTAEGHVRRIDGHGISSEVDIALNPDEQDHAKFTAAFTQ